MRAGLAVAVLVIVVLGYNYLQGVSDGIFANVANALASLDGAAGNSPNPTARTTPKPTPVPDLTFSPIPLTGQGNSVPRFAIPANAVALAEITHVGAANFAVWTVDTSGTEQDLLVNTIGNYTGTVLFDEQLGQHSVAFNVQADGAWTITVKPISQATLWNGAANAAGRGDAVLLVAPPSSGLASVMISHQGSGNFAIWAYSEDGTDLLVNEIGTYTGESLLADGTFVLEITADGSWTITPPQ
jgi:hypothetical protein